MTWVLTRFNQAKEEGLRSPVMAPQMGLTFRDPYPVPSATMVEVPTTTALPDPGPHCLCSNGRLSNRLGEQLFGFHPSVYRRLPSSCSKDLELFSINPDDH
ncbi:unnamed protein product [Nezara viridula]|uniref:Uncharacterized protein n=1 Tax=Nezara viridula TaxID=85310 RepID=A0A9P0MN87_NEZVI|nr:unnamed protein product [Nezara viridula]